MSSANSPLSKEGSPLKVLSPSNFFNVFTESTNFCRFVVAEALSTVEVKFALELVVETKFTVYPSNKSVIVFDALVREIPSTTKLASVPATFCFEAFVVALSMLDRPDPDGFSVAEILSAFSLPSLDFNARVKVSSPAPNIHAVTP